MRSQSVKLAYHKRLAPTKLQAHWDKSPEDDQERFLASLADAGGKTQASMTKKHWSGANADVHIRPRTMSQGAESDQSRAKQL
jgi:hypothetical protein|eukprot:3402238-Prymnesium_polylepis.1